MTDPHSPTDRFRAIVDRTVRFTKPFERDVLLDHVRERLDPDDGSSRRRP